MEPLLELKNISHAYHTKGGETSALSNLSFQVFPGEFLAIIGPSGCGKTTILSIIAGLIPAESGGGAFQRKTHAEAKQRARLYAPEGSAL